MKTSLSEAELVRLLTFPRVSIGVGALMSILSVGCDGCVCPGSVETVIPLPRAQYDELLTLYGADGIPIEECQIICATPVESGSGGAGGGMSSGGAGGAGGMTTSGGAGGMMMSGAGGMTSGGAGGMMTSGGAGGMTTSGGAGGMMMSGAGGASGGAGGMTTSGGAGGMMMSGAGGASGGAGGGASSGGSPAYDSNVLSCVLTTIGFEEGAVECTFAGVDCGMGRRPNRLLASIERTRTRTIAAHFARAAHLEAASVVAFHDLARELALHGLPSHFVRAARESAVDEARHARVMASLAHSGGATVEKVRTRHFEMRSLEALATHNAQEGIAGEAFGALLLGAQASRSRSPVVRRALRGIARDEAQHAVFSMTLGATLDRRLSAPARRRVREARDEALEMIARSSKNDPTSEESRLLGMPSAEFSQDSHLLLHLRNVISRAGV